MSHKISLKIGVVMDPIQSIKPYKDTTLALLLAAQARGHEIYYMEQHDLFVKDNITQARMRQLFVSDTSQDWFNFGAATTQALAQLNIILMRKDPPFNMEYIYTTYLLEQAEAEGVLVINKPQSLRDANEKLFTLWFADVCPPTLVTRDATQVHDFIKLHQDIIVKPLDGMGGAGIFRLRIQDPNINAVIETLSGSGQHYFMAQRYIPEISQGDKRILLINGEPLPYALARIPAAGETRANLAAGGHGVGIALSARDQEICHRVGPTLKAKGLFFVGLDVIGDYLTEINVTSPTCLRELEALYSIDIGAQFWSAAEKLSTENKI